MKKITDLTTEELYFFLKMGDMLATKHFRESQMNQNSEEEYKKMSLRLHKLYKEANKRLTNLE